MNIKYYPRCNWPEKNIRNKELSQKRNEQISRSKHPQHKTQTQTTLTDK